MQPDGGPAARHSHQHGAAHQDQEVETVLVRKQGVPDPDDVWQEKLLRQQQGQPAEGEILRFDVLFFLSGHSGSEPLADVLSGSEGTTEQMVQSNTLSIIQQCSSWFKINPKVQMNQVLAEQEQASPHRE